MGAHLGSKDSQETSLCRAQWAQNGRKQDVKGKGKWQILRGTVLPRKDFGKPSWWERCVSHGQSGWWKKNNCYYYKFCNINLLTDLLYILKLCILTEKLSVIIMTYKMKNVDILLRKESRNCFPAISLLKIF